jgi:DNA-binding MarR family transcriptional regulator
MHHAGDPRFGAEQGDQQVLSKAISTLAAAGYLDVRTGYVGKRPRTWLTATPAGVAAIRIHIAALQAIAAGATA